MIKRVNPNIILGKILQRFKDLGVTQVKGYNSFFYFDESASKLVVTRENGNTADLPFPKILAAIEAYQTDSSLYSTGPSSLRPFGITHISSPVWSILHLLDQREYEY